MSKMKVNKDRLRHALERVKGKRSSVVPSRNGKARQLPPAPRTFEEQDVSIPEQDLVGQQEIKKNRKKNRTSTLTGIPAICVTCDENRLLERHGEDDKFIYAKCPECGTKNKLPKGRSAIAFDFTG